VILFNEVVFEVEKGSDRYFCAGVPPQIFLGKVSPSPQVPPIQSKFPSGSSKNGTSGLSLGINLSDLNLGLWSKGAGENAARRDGAIVAWHEARSAWESVPRKNRPVGYGMIGRS
jgi:hypothetical protein